MDNRGEALETRLYRYAVQQGIVESLATVATVLGESTSDILAAVGRLVELHLLGVDPTVPDRLWPVAPGIAATALLSPIDRSLYRRHDLADRLREQIADITSAALTNDEQFVTIDGLTGVAEIRGLFKLASQSCRRELLILRPSVYDEDLLDELLEPCYGVLDRDVVLRIICQHQSRAGFGPRARVARLADGGAQIRTRSHLPGPTVVFDDSLAVLLDLPGCDDQPTARRLRDRNVVRFLIELVNQIWDDATPFHADEPGYANAADDLRRTIARLMARGFTDEVVARHLGMSVRTCRRHIAALLHDLGSVSRFQAGVHAATRFAISHPHQRTPG